jgi:hypothetical protein
MVTGIFPRKIESFPNNVVTSIRLAHPTTSALIEPCGMSVRSKFSLWIGLFGLPHSETLFKHKENDNCVFDIPDGIC